MYTTVRCRARATPVYEDPAQIAERITVAGLQGSDAITSFILDGQGKDAGTYTLVPSNATVGEATANYAIKYVNGKLTITQKAATVTALVQTIQEDGSIRTGTEWVTLTGAVPGHSLSAITLTAADGKITPSAAKIRDAEGNDVTGNYAIIYVPVTVTPPLPLTTVWSAATANRGRRAAAICRLPSSAARTTARPTGTLNPPRWMGRR